MDDSGFVAGIVQGDFPCVPKVAVDNASAVTKSQILFNADAAADMNSGIITTGNFGSNPSVENNRLVWANFDAVDLWIVNAAVPFSICGIGAVYI